MSESIKDLKLAEPLHFEVNRLGYDDEGIRLTFALGSPYSAHFEVQLSMEDTINLITALTSVLEKETKRGNLK